MKSAFGLLVVAAGSVLAVAAATGLAIGVLAGAVGAASAGGLTGWGSPRGSAPGAGGGLPGALVAVYQRAATACPGLSWTVLAAIATVESANGTSVLPGVHSGANGAGAEGPMQMEPATFAAYDRPVPSGGVDPPSPYDPVDSAYAAARYLCAGGAGTPAGVGGAVYSYNHDAVYVRRVLSLSASYAGGEAADPNVGAADPGSGYPPGVAAGLAAADYALSQVGVPYQWGGETPGVGFDCSGLAQAAYRRAGVALPRVAQDQYDAGPTVPPGGALQVGDLVFFGLGPGSVDHVGIVVDPSGQMVDAPHAGATVRVELFPTVAGQWWGSEMYLGATRPGDG
jgi:cell wall-associated NlpC family hydrolase